MAANEGRTEVLEKIEDTVMTYRTIQRRVTESRIVERRKRRIDDSRRRKDTN